MPKRKKGKDQSVLFMIWIATYRVGEISAAFKIESIWL
jgi:hypothetical protein